MPQQRGRNRRATSLTAAGALWLAGTVGGTALALPAAVDLGHRRELFVDRALIERLDHVTLRLHEPVHARRSLGAGSSLPHRPAGGRFLARLLRG